MRVERGRQYEVCATFMDIFLGRLSQTSSAERNRQYYQRKKRESLPTALQGSAVTGFKSFRGRCRLCGSYREGETAPLWGSWRLRLWLLRSASLHWRKGQEMQVLWGRAHLPSADADSAAAPSSSLLLQERGSCRSVSEQVERLQHRIFLRVPPNAYSANQRTGYAFFCIQQLCLGIPVPKVKGTVWHHLSSVMPTPGRKPIFGSCYAYNAEDAAVMRKDNTTIGEALNTEVCLVVIPKAVSDVERMERLLSRGKRARSAVQDNERAHG